MRAAVIVALLSMSSVAVAQPGTSQPPGLTPPMAPMEPEVTVVVEKKSGGNATLLAIAGTVLPLVLLPAAVESDSGGTALVGLAAVTLLPSAGHWYAGKPVTKGMGLRVLGVSATMLGLFTLIASEGSADEAGYLALGGLGLYAVGAIHDIATAHKEVDSWNKKHATALRPTVLTMKASDGFGLGVAGRF